MDLIAQKPKLEFTSLYGRSFDFSEKGILRFFVDFEPWLSHRLADEDTKLSHGPRDSCFFVNKVLSIVDGKGIAESILEGSFFRSAEF